MGINTQGLPFRLICFTIINRILIQEKTEYEFTGIEAGPYI